MGKAAADGGARIACSNWPTSARCSRLSVASSAASGTVAARETQGARVQPPDRLLPLRSKRLLVDRLSCSAARTTRDIVADHRHRHDDPSSSFSFFLSLDVNLSIGSDNMSAATNGVPADSAKSETKRPAEVFESQVPLPSGESAPGHAHLPQESLLALLASRFHFSLGSAFDWNMLESRLPIPQRREKLRGDRGRSRSLYVTRNCRICIIVLAPFFFFYLELKI